MTFWRVARLRCPVCGRGRMWAGGMRLNARCERCGVVFERSVGEFTGGMGLNTVAACFGIAALAFWVGMSDLPWRIGQWIVLGFAVLFPVAFYVHSRALWVGFLYLARLVHDDATADPEPVIRVRR